MTEVQVPRLSADRFASLLPEADQQRFARRLQAGHELLAGRRFWHVNSTADGGGVAEMLHSLLGYLTGAGIDARWEVVEADEDFFAVTKRVHNRLHGHRGDDGRLSRSERKVYDATLAAAADGLAERVRPGDVVVLHDPQTAGLAQRLKLLGAVVIWSCHVGVDDPNDVARSAWDFLHGHVAQADAHVFSRRRYAWDGLPPEKVTVIPPCIDAFSAKNIVLPDPVVESILQVARLLPGTPSRRPAFARKDGSSAVVRRSADIQAPVPPDVPVVAQVSRWDRLKDPVGVLRAFVDHVPAELGAHLVLAGPACGAVTDDPEGAAVFEHTCAARDRLPEGLRERVHVTCLPADDLEENAAIVNALQRRADVIVQKSLAEGFGLTVAEAMWKQRPIVGSSVGGIQDQIVHAETGLLVDDPHDLPDFGAAVTKLLADPRRAAAIGRAARERVAERYLVPTHLGRYLALLDRLAAPVGAPVGDPA